MSFNFFHLQVKKNGCQMIVLLAWLWSFSRYFFLVFVRAFEAHLLCTYRLPYLFCTSGCIRCSGAGRRRGGGGPFSGGGVGKEGGVITSVRKMADREAYKNGQISNLNISMTLQLIYMKRFSMANIFRLDKYFKNSSYG